MNTYSGQIPTAVEMQFLERVKWLDLYGCELHSVMVNKQTMVLPIKKNMNKFYCFHLG